MAFVFMVIVLVIFFGMLAILIGFVNLLTGTSQTGPKKTKSRNTILNAVRERFGAENMRPHRLGQLNVFRPALQFDYGRTMARLKHVGSPWRGVNRKTILEADFELPHGTYIQIFNRRPLSGNEFSGDTIKTGDEDFDQAFRVLSNQPRIVAELLTDSVKWKLVELQQLVQGPLQVDLKQDRLKVTCSGWFQTGRNLLDYVQGSLELFDQLMLPKAEGVEFLHSNQAAVIEDFRCPICSDDVMHEMVVCRRCKTPHCAECWEYNGKCAMFACMEDRCIRVEEQEL